MRQTVLAILVLFLTILKSNSQENRIAFGIKAGPSYTGLSQNPAMADIRQGSFKWAFHAGVFMKIPLSKTFSIVPEVNYSAQGQKTDYIFWSRPQKTEVTLNYLTMPLMIDIKGINIEGTRNVNIQVGGQYGYLLFGDEPFDRPGDPNYKPMFTTHDFSLCVGFSASLTDNISIGARYIHGLTDINYKSPLLIFTVGPNTQSPVEKEKNRALQVFASYSF
jgi:hypothetical protein